MTLQKFESRACEMDNTKFAGVNIRTTDFGFDLEQKDYASKSHCFQITLYSPIFTLNVLLLAWLVHTAGLDQRYAAL